MADFNWQTGYHRYRRYFTDLSKFYQKKKARVYVEIILSLLAVTFFISFAIRPTFKTIAQLIRETKDQRTVSSELEKKINNLSEAQRNYLTIEPELVLIEEALPQKAEVTLLTKEIETLAHRSGIAIVNLRFTEVNLTENQTGKQEKQEVKFSFNALGDYPNLKNFLRDLMSLRRVVLVKAFSFQTGKSESNILSLNLNGQAWFLTKP
jgi:Tfp pilus assembly protein PilO